MRKIKFALYFTSVFILLFFSICCLKSKIPEGKTVEQIPRSKLIVPPVQNWFPKAPLLPDLKGDVIKVVSVEGLYKAVERVKPGGTILLANGYYPMPQNLIISTDDVTLRSENDDRTEVVLDFHDSSHGEGVVINSVGFTLASLTVQNVRQNGIKINSNLGADRVTIYNVIEHNVWQRHIKGPGVPDNDDGTPSWVEDCRVQYCLFYNDRAKKLDDEPYEEANPGIYNGNYIGGMDIMNAKDWVISDNVFIGIRGRTGGGRGGIFMWYNSYNCIIERNIFIDCDSGICLGNSHGREEERRHCTGFVVRNNFVTRINASEGIFVGHTRDCRILHNTVHNTDEGRLIRIAHSNDGLLVVGNIFSGSSRGVRIDDSNLTGKIIFRDNLNKPMTDVLVNPKEGDLHLKSGASEAIDKGYELEGIIDDIDRQLRDDIPDLGADEFVSSEK